MVNKNSGYQEGYSDGYNAGLQTSEKNAEQERIKAKIETLTKFRYRSYESIEEELNNLNKQLENGK